MTVTKQRPVAALRVLAFAIRYSLFAILAGCTAESTRVALEAQQRADQVQQAVFDRQHEALCVLLYRDLVGRLESGGATLSGGGSALSPALRAELSTVWNDRDLIEFWAMQYERSRALRLAGVDAKLFADQSIVDLLWKAIETRAQRARQGLSGRAATQAAQDADAADVLLGGRANTEVVP